MNLRESGGSGDQPLFRSAVDGGHVPTLRALNEGSVAQIPGVKVAQKGNLVGLVAPRSTTHPGSGSPPRSTWDQPPMLPEDGYLNRKIGRQDGICRTLTFIRFLRPGLWLDGFPRSQRPMFLVLGVGTEIVAILALLVFFRRRGWF